MEACELLTQLPIAGEYEEILFGEDSGSFTWVKFSEHRGNWLGVFQHGLFSSEKDSASIVGTHAVVLAGGLLYVVDLRLRTARLLQYKDAIQAVIADETQIFTAAFTAICVFDYQGNLLKAIEGYYFDLFRFEEITESKVSASFYQTGGNWTGLTVDRQTLELVGKKAA